MSEKILKLVPSRSVEANASCIEALEAALVNARAGEAVGVVVFEQCPDGDATWNWGGMCGSYSLLGAIDVAKACLVEDHIEAMP